MNENLSSVAESGIVTQEIVASFQPENLAQAQKVPVTTEGVRTQLIALLKRMGLTPAALSAPTMESLVEDTVKQTGQGEEEISDRTRRINRYFFNRLTAQHAK